MLISNAGTRERQDRTGLRERAETDQETGGKPKGSEQGPGDAKDTIKDVDETNLF